MFITGGDYEDINGKWVSGKKECQNVKQRSIIYKYNYEILFYGRRFVKKVDLIPGYFLARKI